LLSRETGPITFSLLKIPNLICKMLSSSSAVSAVTIGICCCSLLLSGAAPEDKRIAIFSNVATYSLPVSDLNGQEYAGLLEVLEPLGTVTAKADQKHWKLRYNSVELEFSVEKSRVRMKGGDFDLDAPFVIQNGRGLVPISSLGPLLSRILGGPVTFNPASRRIFIGNVAVHFTAQVAGSPSPSLIMNFTAPVSPMIATEADKLRMTFTHEPIVSSGTQTLSFDNRIIVSATYQEGNGAAEITIAGNAPLFANFSNGGKTITISPAPGAVPTRGTQIVPPAPNGSPAMAVPVPVAKAYFAVIDAGHGGDDRGAMLAGQLVEKDLTLAFARRIQQEIESRGLPVLMLRTADTTLSLDDRAGTTNYAHPSVYICIHVTSQGSGVNVYTALLPSGAAAPAPLLNWNAAQSSLLTRSKVAAEILSSAFENSRIPVRTLTAPLRPLNNITAPAIAVEIAPPAGGPSGLNSTEYQQAVASTIATAVATMHAKSEVPQ
jgi:N-acetylmuramoyl-L-alanine amidase